MNRRLKPQAAILCMVLGMFSVLASAAGAYEGNVVTALLGTISTMFFVYILEKSGNAKRKSYEEETR